MSSLSAVLLSNCLLLSLFRPTSCLYKQWVPNTNFENVTNWDKGAVPCSSDRVQFLAHKEVSVYVGEAHSVLEMSLPVKGEFILASGAGFVAGGGQDSGCGAGVTVQFQDSDPLQWFDPALWQTASSSDDLLKGHFLFSVHEESVPCQYDDVVFRAATSFRVDTSAGQSSIPVRSLSVLGRKFSNNQEFSQYLTSGSGQLQFHGDSTPRPGSSACEDSSGCACGNTVHHERICANVACSPLDCKKPLRPTGHCCDVCGAIIHLKITSNFNLEAYRQRLFSLTSPQYQAVQLGISKVTVPEWILGVIPRGAAVEIQVVVLDNEEEGGGPGALSEDLARNIMKDIQSQGAELGIEEAEFQASSGNSLDTGGGAGVVAGIVLGILALVAAVLFLAFLFHRGVVRVPSLPSLPSFPSLPSWSKSSEIGELGGPLDHGFDNPMFDKPSQVQGLPGLYGPDSLNSITVTNSGVHFVNPAYDETDFNA